MSPQSQPTVFIVDDDDAVRDSIAELVESVGLRARGFASAAAFVEAVAPDRPGCLVLDVRMAGMSGLALQQELNTSEFTLPIIILTGHGDVPMAVQAMKNGAMDFIQKPYREQALLDSINVAIAKNRADEHSRASNFQLHQHLSKLTERETEVFEHLCSGRSSKKIAKLLDISPRTVEAHRHNILQKLELSSVKDLLLLVAGEPS